MFQKKMLNDVNGGQGRLESLGKWEKHEVRHRKKTGGESVAHARARKVFARLKRNSEKFLTGGVLAEKKKKFQPIGSQVRAMSNS